MRPGVLTIIALLTFGIVAAQAEEQAPAAKSDSAVTPTPETAVSKPDGESKPGPSPSSEAQSTAAETKADKQPAGVKIDTASARFGFQRVDDGFLRFDYQTGHVAYCNSRPEGWGCQAVPEDRSALEREVERLRAEVGDLKNKLQKMEEPLRPPQPIPPPTKPTPPAPGTAPSTGTGGDMTFSLPGRDHIARAASAVQEAWQHFVEMVTAFKNDVLRKNGA